MPSQVYTTAGTFTWHAPAGVTSVTAQCWGAGGGGAEASSGADSGGGGGGGEFAQDTVGVTPSSGYTVVVGAAGAGGSGQEGSGNGANGGSGANSTFTGNAGAVVTAHGGSGGQLNPKGGGQGPGGTGGTGSANAIHFSGGTGGNGNSTTIGGGGGGSGGGSAAGSAGGSSTGSASITVVQSAQGLAGNSTSVTIALASPTTAGNCLVAVIESYSTSSNQQVTGVTIGGLADNWSQLASYGNNGTLAFCSFWADPNCTGGQASVKISCSAGTGTSGVAASVYEVSGLVTSSLLDVTAGRGNGNSGTSWTSGSTSTTSQATEIAFGGVDGAGTVVVTGPGAPWVNLASQADPSGYGTSIAGYSILSSTGTQAYAGTFGPAVSRYSSGIVTLKGGAGVGGTGAPAVALGGPGGNGGTTGPGLPPASGPGGGGGASALQAQDGGAGYAGQVILTWTVTPTPPTVVSGPLTIPGPVASVLAGALAANASSPYNSLGAGQRRRATIATTTNYPALPSLMTDVVFMPEFAVLDANVTVTGQILAQAGVDVSVAGQGLAVIEGTNCKQGTGTLVSGVAVVQNTSVTANSRIFLTGQADGASPGWLRVSTRSPGVSFTVTSSSAGDTSTFAYELFEPG